METFIFTAIASMAATLTVIGLSKRESKKPRTQHALTSNNTAYVVCSACGGMLSGLGSVCPWCKRRVIYYVPKGVDRE